MSNKTRKRRRRSSGTTESDKVLMVALAAAGALVIVVAAVLLLSGGGEESGAPDDFVPEVSGEPRLALLTGAVLDLGDVQVNRFVDSVFRVQNVGDQPLILQSDQRPQVVAGC